MRTRGDYTLLDTSVIVALLDSKDSLHKRSVEMVEKARAERFAVLHEILTETYSVIARRCRERKYDCREAVKAVMELEGELEVIYTDPGKYHYRIVEKLLGEPDLSYNDWLLILFAQDKGVNVLSLDKRLNKKLKTS